MNEESCLKRHSVVADRGLQWTNPKRCGTGTSHRGLTSTSHNHRCSRCRTHPYSLLPSFTRLVAFMSSSSRLSPHRRRSHSASSPLPSSRHFSTDKWRTACKRPRAGIMRSPPYTDYVSDLPADKWDVDKWRRGKKARRESLVSPCVIAV